MIKFIDKIILNDNEYSYKPFNFDVKINIIKNIIPYVHEYLKKHYTHEQMTQYTQGELSQHA